MRWYFDYISPYAYLQSTQLDALAEIEEVTCVPVLFAGLLEHWGNIGPAEIAPKRDWTFKNVVWLAHRDGIDLTMPSHHPFNPLPLLRLGIALGNEIEVVQRLFRFVWLEGHVPTESEAFASLLSELNVNEAALANPQVKSALIENGKLAQQNKVFGVPTIERNGELFWGYDSTEMIIAHGEDSNWPGKAMLAASKLPEGSGRLRKQQSSQPAHTTSKEPRLPLQPIDLKEPADLVNAIRKRRGGELIELDRLLLYSTPLATGWNHFLGNIRTEFSVSHKLRELAMCTVAVVNKADYEFTHHAPIYIKAGGTEEKTSALKDINHAAKQTNLFDLDELLTIKLATQMTRDIQVDDDLFVSCRETFEDNHLVELIATIAAYNMVSRFLVALNVVP